MKVSASKIVVGFGYLPSCEQHCYTLWYYYGPQHSQEWSLRAEPEKALRFTDVVGLGAWWNIEWLKHLYYKQFQKPWFLKLEKGSGNYIFN